MLFTQLLFTNVAFAATNRYSGADRYATALDIVKNGWTQSDAAIIARGDDEGLADALAAAPLAYAKGKAPIFLTETNRLHDGIMDELNTLGVKTVYIVGGPGAVSTSVEKALKAQFGNDNVKRIYGADRVATSVAVAKELPAYKEAALVNGYAYADALSISSIAAASGTPILLTSDKDTLSADVSALISDKTVYAVGGAGVLSDTLVKKAGAKRLSGLDRYKTNAAVLDSFNVDYSNVYLANGADTSAADALAGSALAARTNSPIVLVDYEAGTVVANAANVLKAGLKTDSQIIILGGTGVLPDSAATAVEALKPQYTSGVAGFITNKTDDKVVKDAVVTIGGQSGTTNKDGYFAVKNVPAGKYDVTVKAQGFDTVTVKGVNVVTDKLSTVNVQLDELVSSGITISGVVIDSATGAAVKDAKVTLDYNDPKDGWVEGVAAVTTGANGVFSIDQKAAKDKLVFGGQYRVNVSYDNVKAAYHGAVVNVTLKSDAVANVLDGIELTPVKAINVIGTVKDSKGAAVNRGTVALLDGEGTQLAAATTDSTGKYSFAGLTLPTGAYTLKVDKAGNAVYAETINVTEGTDVAKDINLAGGYNVSFTLGTEAVNGAFSTKDADVADYTATLLKGNVEVAKNTVTGTKDADDTSLAFAFSRIAEGTYTLRVTGNYVTAKDFAVTVVDKDVTASGRTTPAGYVTGTVTGTGAIKDAEVQLLDSNKAVVAETTTDESGNYEFKGVAAGSYTVSVSANGYVTKASTSAFTVNADTKSTEDFALSAVATTGNISGFVRSSGTLAAASGAKVSYYALSVADVQAGTFVKGATVSSNGSYSVTALKPGTYKVVVRNAGNFETFVTTQAVAAGDDLKDVNYRLTTGGKATLNVTVVDKDNKAVSVGKGNLKMFDSFADEIKDTALTNKAAGNTFAFTNLASGTYHLTIAAPLGYEAVDTTISVAAGAANDVKIQLVKSADAYNVSFRVVDNKNADVEGAQVVAFNADGTIMKSDKTVGGVATISGLVNGTYTFYTYYDGTIVAVSTVTVNGANVNVPVIQLVQY